MTYSIYLVHFPIQVCFILVLKHKDYTVSNDPKILLLLLVTSVISGYRYEKPVQRYLGSKFKPRSRNEIQQLPADNITRRWP